MGRKQRHQTPSKPRDPANQPQVPGGSNRIIAGHTCEHWSGPLPPPAALEHFERIIPDGAARILSMAEAEQAHRMTLEQSAQAAMIRDKLRGQWMGAIVAALSIFGAVTTAIFGGHWAVSVAMVGIPLAAIVRALIAGR